MPFIVGIINTFIGISVATFALIAWWDEAPLFFKLTMVIIILFLATNGYQILIRYLKKDIGIWIKDGHMEDHSNIFAPYKIDYSNIQKTEIKSISLNKYLVIKLKDKREFMRGTPLLSRFYFLLVGLMQGSPASIMERSLLRKRVEDIQVLIEMRMKEMK